MNIGINAPQIYQYPLNLFHGTDCIDDDGYKFTPEDVSKVVERERSKLEILMGTEFLYSGFNLWTFQKLTEDIVL